MIFMMLIYDIYLIFISYLSHIYDVIYVVDDSYYYGGGDDDYVISEVRFILSYILSLFVYFDSIMLLNQGKRDDKRLMLN